MDAEEMDVMVGRKHHSLMLFQPSMTSMTVLFSGEGTYKRAKDGKRSKIAFKINGRMSPEGLMVLNRKVRIKSLTAANGQAFDDDTQAMKMEAIETALRFEAFKRKCVIFGGENLSDIEKWKVVFLLTACEKLGIRMQPTDAEEFYMMQRGAENRRLIDHWKSKGATISPELEHALLHGPRLGKHPALEEEYFSLVNRYGLDR